MNNGPVQVCVPSVTSSYSSLPLQRKVQLNSIPPSAGQTVVFSSNAQLSNGVCLENRLETISVQERILNEQKPNELPRRYNRDNDGPYGSMVNANRVKFFEQLKKDVNNLNIRYHLGLYQLLTAGVYKHTFTTVEDLSETVKLECIRRADLYLNKAEQESQQLKILNPLHPLSLYIDCLILEYQGVDCTNIEQAEKYIRLLKLSVALDFDNQHPEIKENLDEAIAYVRQRWSTLHQEGSISDKVYQKWQRKLERTLAGDSLKSLFIKNPRLFDLSRLTTHAAFFARYPEFKNKQACVAKYPEYAKELGIELPTPIQQLTPSIAQQPTFPKPISLKENTQPADNHVQLKDLDKDKYSLQTMKEIEQKGKVLKECIVVEAVELIQSDGTHWLVFVDRQKAEEFVGKFASLSVHNQGPYKGPFNIKGINYKVSIAPEDKKEKLKEAIRKNALQFTIENRLEVMQQVTSPNSAKLVEKEKTEPQQLIEKISKDETYQSKKSNITHPIQTIDEIVEQRLPLSKCILLDLIPVKGSDGTPELIFLDKQKAEEFVSQFAVTKQNGSFFLKGIRHKIMIAPQHIQSKLREKLHRIASQDATGSMDSKSNFTSSFLLEIWRTAISSTLS